MLACFMLLLDGAGISYMILEISSCIVPTRPTNALYYWHSYTSLSVSSKVTLNLYKCSPIMFSHLVPSLPEGLFQLVAATLNESKDLVGYNLVGYQTWYKKKEKETANITRVTTKFFLEFFRARLSHIGWHEWKSLAALTVWQSYWEREVLSDKEVEQKICSCRIAENLSCS